MRKFKFFTLIIALSFIYAGSDALAQKNIIKVVSKLPKKEKLKLSLFHAYGYALNSSSAIKAAKAGIEISKAKLKQANSMFMPKLYFQETFYRTNDQVGVFGSKLRQGGFSQQDFDIGALNNPDSINNMESKLGLNMPVFTSGMTMFMHNAAKKGFEASKYEAQFAESNIKKYVGKVYYGIVSAEESLSHITEGIFQLEQLEKSYKLIQAPNSATTTCFLLSQATRFSLEQKARHVSTQIENLYETLRSLLEIPEDTEIELTDSIYIPEPLAHLGGLTEQSDEKLRGDIASLALSLEAVKYQKKSIYSMLGPRIDFFTSYAYNHPVWGSGEDAYQLGFVLTFNIFDYSKYGKLGEIKATEQKINFAYKEKIKNNRSAIKKAKNTVDGKYSEVNLAKISFEKADNALQFANLRYKQGTLALKDLSDAIARWVEAKVNVAQAKYNLMDSNIELQFERGEL